MNPAAECLLSPAECGIASHSYTFCPLFSVKSRTAEVIYIEVNNTITLLIEILSLAHYFYPHWFPWLVILSKAKDSIRQKYNFVLNDVV